MLACVGEEEGGRFLNCDELLKRGCVGGAWVQLHPLPALVLLGKVGHN